MGLAILAVILSHAAGWGQIAMFNWANQVRPGITVPNYDLVGTLDDYILLVLRQVTSFAVPAFLFCSGFFVAFAARSNRGIFTWRMVRVRLVNLLIPYLIWSLVWYALDFVQGDGYPPWEFAGNLVMGMTDGSGSYYFVPLVCQFYLLSPFIMRWARANPRALIAVAAGVQLVAFGFKYLEIFKVSSPAVQLLAWLPTHWLIFLWALYFPLGVVCAVHSERVRQVAARHARALLAALILSLLLAILEPELIYRVLHVEIRFVPLTIPPALYSLVLVFAFVTLEQVKVPYANNLYRLGGKSYGIYLVHLKAMEFTARLIRYFVPALLAFPVTVIMPVTFIVGLTVPLVMMRVVSQTRLRGAYRYLFG
jgi:peptidoglycan/LPS O-acetylase OafA/YrhL